MPVYTRRLLIAEFGTGGTYETLYTAPPAPPHIILRDLVLTNSHTAAGRITLTISAPIRLPPATFFTANLAAATSVHVDLRQELLPGERLVAISTTGPWSIAITGYFLT